MVQRRKHKHTSDYLFPFSKMHHIRKRITIYVRTITVCLLSWWNPGLRFPEKTVAMNNWGASPPHTTLQFRWKRAARDSIVQHRGELRLWKCYYFVTKGSKSLQYLCHRESHFSCQQSFCWNRHHIFKRWISHCEMKLFRGRICYLLWLHLNIKHLSDYCSPDLPAGEELVSPSAFLPLSTKTKTKEKKNQHEKCLIHELNLFSICCKLPDI